MKTNDGGACYPFETRSLQLNSISYDDGFWVHICGHNNDDCGFFDLQAGKG